MAIANNINNYYEQVVAREIHRQLDGRPKEPSLDFMADVACVALNRLPPKYYRYEVDMAFYMSPNELNEVDDRVTLAVKEAVAFVEQHGRSD
jgi:competence protein ComFB